MLKKCSHFEWIDQYVARLEFEGHIEDPNLGGFAPDVSSGRGGPAARITRPIAGLPVEAEVNEELKKIKKFLKQMVDLQKQANLMSGAFYSCIIALFFVYLLFIRR